LCRSDDPDQGDSLNWQYNFGDSGRNPFNADGSFNPDADHVCRVEHTYAEGTYTAWVSVTDKHLEDQSKGVAGLARRSQAFTVRAEFERAAGSSCAITSPLVIEGCVSAGSVAVEPPVPAPPKAPACSANVLKWATSGDVVAGAINAAPTTLTAVELAARSATRPTQCGYTLLITCGDGSQQQSSLDCDKQKQAAPKPPAGEKG